MKHYNIKVFGKVQGVGFRHSVMKMAMTYEIYGFVQNELDGSVYMEVEGEIMSLELFIGWCENGPGYGRVDRISKSESNLKHFKDFSIRH